MIRSAEVARHLNADPSLVARWVRRGMPLASMSEALAWHAATIRPRRRLDALPSEPDRASAPAAPSGSMSAQLLEARLLREKSEATTAAIKLAELRKQVMRVEDAVHLWQNLATNVKQAFLNLPSRVAPLVAAETSATAVQILLQREVNQTLTDLANGVAAAEATVGAPHDADA